MECAVNVDFCFFRGNPLNRVTKVLNYQWNYALLVIMLNANKTNFYGFHLDDEFVCWQRESKIVVVIK
jgi:hypothetical protein